MIQTIRPDIFLCRDASRISSHDMYLAKSCSPTGADSGGELINVSNNDNGKDKFPMPRDHTLATATQSIANPFFSPGDQGGWSRHLRRAIHASARSDGVRAARSFGIVRRIRRVRPPPRPRPPCHRQSRVSACANSDINFNRLDRSESRDGRVSASVRRKNASSSRRAVVRWPPRLVDLLLCPDKND
jgi:hypothetical protein